jgi:pimeloyl-ACP methyl ester carboxylesterase
VRAAVTRVTCGGAPWDDRCVTDVLLLPGVVLPASLAYGALLDALPERIHAVAKDLEVYAGVPSADYTLDLESDGIRRAAAEAGFGRFHLVGYSAGGAAALWFATLQPERLRSLALLEPAWAGNRQRTKAEQALHAEFVRAMALPADERMRRFVRLQLAAGVEPPPPPPGPSPPWMASRPAGVAAIMAAFEACEPDFAPIAVARVPVLYVLGGRSNQAWFAAIADRLAADLPDFTLQRFEDRHHFDPPHRAEPERLAQTLVEFWSRSDR